MREGYKETSIGVIPEEWSEKTIGDVTKFSGGAQPERRTFIFEPHEDYIRLIQTRDYKSDKYATYIQKKLAKKFCNKTDIIIGRYGPPIFQIFRGMEGAYNVALLKAIPIEEFVFQNYLFYFLKQYNVWAFVENLSQRSGGQTGVDLAMLKQYPFPLPPLTEQEKIIAILTTADDKIESIDNQISKAIELKKGLMQKLFSEGIGHTEFKDSPVGKIPVDWEVKKLKDLTTKIGSGVTPRGGSEVYQVSGIPLIRSQNVLNGSLKLDDVAYISDEIHQKMARTHLSTGDVLLNITGASIGRCAIVPSGFTSGNVNQHVCIIRTIPKFNEVYLCQLLISSMGQSQIYRCQAGGNREGLNFQQIASFNIPSTPLKEQQKIASILTCSDDKISVLKDKKVAYTLLKKGLMQKLLTGEIRVKVDG